MREVRRIAADYQRQGGDWRDVIDAMRPLVSTLWKSWPQQDKTRFVEHAAPYWEVHRHRCPVSTSRMIDQLRAQGPLEVDAARPETAYARPEGTKQNGRAPRREK